MICNNKNPPLLGRTEAKINLELGKMDVRGKALYDISEWEGQIGCLALT
ncbi:hypothetical protein TAMC210_16650 [Thermanaeromonas sp. C210]|nr:hypothetical protein TAMC210_16650 [Thermanaeromonas sp. C210]